MPQTPERRRFNKSQYTEAERQALARGSSGQAVGQVRWIRQALEKDPELRERFRVKTGINRAKDRSGDWITSRGFSIYNEIFHTCTGKDLLNKLVELAIKLRRPLRVLDDGAGVGRFLQYTKKELLARGVKTITTAVALEPQPELRTMHAEGTLDKLHIGLAETFLPEEKQDVIFSVFGSIEYTLPEFKRRILLKYSHSLNKGGFAVVGVQLGFHSNEEGRANAFKSAVVNSFAKQGFFAQFYNYEDSDPNIPKDILFIRRLR